MEETAKSTRIVRFGAFELDVKAGQLRAEALKIMRP
jgi:hypothetical protein